MLRLPLGSVRPEGWMRDWVQAAADGVLGGPEKLTPPESAQVFGKGWTGVDLPGSKGAGPKGSNWPMEQCATWLDGAFRLGVMLDDKALTEKILKRLLFIAAGMEKTDKDFDTFIWWWTTDQEPPKDFDLKSNGWLGRAMASAYEDRPASAT